MAISRSPLSLPLFVAQDQDLFHKNGLTVKAVECLGGVKCLDLALEGKADVITCAEIPVVLNAFNRTDYSLIATFVSNKDDMRIVANTASHIHKPRDLIGKRLGVINKGTSQYYADLFLLFYQIDPASVTHVNLSAEELLPALEAGKVDAISVWEPLGEIALRENSRDYKRLEAPSIYAQTFNLVVMDAIKDQHREDIQKLLKSVKQAIDIIHQNPAYSKALLVHRLDLPLDVVNKVWRGFRYELSLRPSLLTTMRGQLNWAIDSGYATGPNKTPNLLDVVDPQPLKRFDPALEGLQKP
ncbi:ABC transporter substrate-binding protein [Limnobacter litoralis]|uniref:ABC transporter substrate-binding protein n=1 Tax=Limnobacter litoralis TaxID=481366 RepID=UPI0024E0641C|nr:NrtA/SsuA/CpmA family ABC transporter substrate-binding protein [Limnobacter litoralis]